MIAGQQKRAINRLESRKVMRPLVDKMYIEGVQAALEGKPVAWCMLNWWGSPLTDAGLIEMIEGLDSNVVMDDICIGSRHFWETTEVRFGYLGDYARDWSVNGVIMQSVRYCDTLG